MEPYNLTNKNTLIKAALIIVLSMLLLIPTLIIEDLVFERKQRQESVTSEVGMKWGAPQTMHGFVLAVLYNTETKSPNGKVYATKEQEIFQPVRHNLSAYMQVQLRKRSIYQVPLYDVSGTMNDRFNISRQENPKIPAEGKIAEAMLCLPVTDRSGVNKEITAMVNGRAVILNNEITLAGYPNPLLAGTIDVSSLTDSNEITITANYSLKGSGSLYFYPNGKQNHIELNSPWKHPSFQGYEVPDSNRVDKSGFFAVWEPRQQTAPATVAQQNEPSSEIRYATPGNTFGVAVLQPGDSYAKTMRTIKYAVLVIMLSFSVFFITELVKRIPVHALQYILVGAALVIFYTLLLAISEYTSYDPAYIIAALSTVLLIGFYTAGVYRSISLGLAFTLFMGALYAFIFVLVQLQDSALLIGSIGLFFVVAAGMYLTRKMNAQLTQRTVTAEQ